MSTTLFLNALLGAVTLWAESPLDMVYPDSAPRGTPSSEYRMYAAGGEHESFQLCVRADESGWAGVTVTGASLGPGISPPRVERVGYLTAIDAGGTRSVIPDPLLDGRRFDLGPNETASLWITYAVHPDCTPGTYSGEIQLSPAEGRSQSFTVVLDVFDVQIPAIPSLAAVFDLDRTAIQSRYNLPPRDLGPWMAVYDALSPYRIAYSIWSDRDDVVVTRRGVSADSFQEHLAYAVRRGNMAVVDIGCGHDAITAFPAPSAPNQQDTLQSYFHEMGTWASEAGWGDRLMFRPAPLGPPDGWQEVRAHYFRARRADDRIALVMRGPLHPFFERYVDVWSVPLDAYQPVAHGLLAGGRSLSVRPAMTASSVTASSVGAPQGGTAVSRPEDAYDGSVFSEWWSAEAKKSGASEWLRVVFSEPLATDHIRVGWVPGLEGKDVVVRTSFDGRVFSRAKVSWSHRLAAHPYDQSVSDGTFVTTKRLAAIELGIEKRSDRVAIAEVEFAPPLSDPMDRPRPARLWLTPPARGFPALQAGGTRGGPRLAAWMAVGHRADGIDLGTLNPWPASWKPGKPLESPSAFHGWTYPGADGILGSIRLHQLRDGLEDAEYVKAVRALGESGVTVPPDLENIVRTRYFTSDAQPTLVNELLAAIPTWRVTMGRFLTNPDAPRTNFQGRTQ